MSFWSSLIGGGVKEAGEGISAALGGAGGFLKDARTAITGKDPELDAKLLAAQEKIDAAQAEINKIEAGSSTFFVAGWRPAIGWVCAVSMAVYFIPKFIAATLFWCYGAYQVFAAWNGALPIPQLPAYPDVGIGDIIGLVMALLGMGGIRAVEKIKGVAR